MGSEVVQHFLPNDRSFDPWDVLSNVLGSLAALGLAGAYHKRAADRRRRAKYAALAADGLGDDDLELGEGQGFTGSGQSSEQQETGVINAERHRTVEEELDNWDENVPDDDWDEDDANGQPTKMTPATSSAGSEDVPKKMATD